MDKMVSRIRGKKVTFKKYLELGLKRKVWGEGFETDFAWSAFYDDDLPDFEEWDEENLTAYLVDLEAMPETVTAAKKLFQKWRAA